MSIRGGALGWYVATSILLCVAVAAQTSPGFEDCEREPVTAVSAARVAYCLYGAAGGRVAAAEERLLDLRRRFPQEPWIPLYLALIDWPDSAKAERFLAEAASGFAARNELEEEVNARTMRLRALSSLGRIEDAAEDVRRVVDLGPQLETPELQAAALLMRARYLISGLRDFGAAQVLLREALEKVPFSPLSIQKQFLVDQGDVSLALGEFEAATDAFAQLTRIARAEPSGSGVLAEAQGLYGELRVLREASIDEPRPGARETALDLAEQTLEAALRAGSRDVEAKARLVLGLLLEGAAARQQLERCVEIAEADSDRSACLSGLARVLTAPVSFPSTAPSAMPTLENAWLARRAADRALDLARTSGNGMALIYALREQVRLAWRLGAPEAAWAATRTDLTSVEALRDLQPGAYTQAQIFSMLSPHFYLLSGKLLEDHLESGRAVSLDRAFEIVERFRARSLTDRLERMRGEPRPSAEAAEIERRRAEVLHRISILQRGLLTADPTSAPGRKNLDLLSSLEAEERRLEERLARTDPPLAHLRGGFAKLADIRTALAPEEAFLSFQIGPWEDMRGDFGGGAWLVVVSRARSRVVPLRSPLIDRLALRDAVRFFSGLVERRDGSEARSAAALYQALLAEGLAGLGPEIRRLVLVPDDALHLLPFGALRSSTGGFPLAARFDLAVVPSASLWLRWRRSQPVWGLAPALVFADPPIPGGPRRAEGKRERAGSNRAAIFAETFGLRPLPGARREGRNAAYRLGEGSELYVGAGASESWLKARLGRPFGLLHLAAHAVVDEAVPERSGILLAPGSDGEDGLLQIREIVGLRLEGKVVVLSACRTAAGSVVRGEGVMGLARAFFQAGAHTVVASLWPLDDEAGAALFETFYREIGAGRSVTEALRRAQERRISDGAPAFDWAGVIVLGDGDLVPLPGGVKGARHPSRWTGRVALVLVLGLGVASAVVAKCWRKGRRGRRSLQAG